MTGIDGSLTYVQLRQASLDVKLSKLTTGATEATGGAAQADRVTLSVQATELLTQQLIVDRTLGGAEGGDEPLFQIDLFEEAGRSEYLAGIESPTDLSSEATAGRILGGITGYIYGAFRLGRPDANSEDFEQFFEQVSAGFEQGLTEALEILDGLAALDEELSASIEETARLVREGLAGFHDTEAARFGDGGETETEL